MSRRTGRGPRHPNGDSPIARLHSLLAESGALADASGKGRLHMQSAPDARREGRGGPSRNASCRPSVCRRSASRRRHGGTRKAIAGLRAVRLDGEDIGPSRLLGLVSAVAIRVLFACQVGGRVGIPVGFVDGQAVKRAVELAVAAAVQAVALGVTSGGGIGALAPVRASFASVRKRSAPAISPISLAAVTGRSCALGAVAGT
jgi:hypothetical protein